MLDSDFVVDKDDGDAEHFFLRLIDSLFQKFKVHQPIFFNGEIGDFVPLEFKVSGGVQNALMLNLSGDDVFPFLPIKACQTLQNHVVGLGGS